MAVAACASLVRARRPCAADVRLNVSVAPDANADRPIPSTSSVWNKQTEAKVGELSAKDWFGKKSSCAANPGEKTFAYTMGMGAGPGGAGIDLAIPARNGGICAPSSCSRTTRRRAFTVFG